MLSVVKVAELCDKPPILDESARETMRKGNFARLMVA
jgi:hypothetical protein